MKGLFMLLLTCCLTQAYGQKYEKQYKEALKLIERGKQQQALSMLDKVLEVHPHHVEARIERMKINQTNQEYKALCADLNTLRLYGRNDADQFECPDCPDLIRKKGPVVLQDTTYVRNEIPAEMPVYPGGDMSLLNEIARNVVYPEDCIRNGIEGKVMMKFIVEKDGSITNISVLKGVPDGRSLEMEAHKALCLVKNFSSPCRQYGKPVRIEMSIPVVFKLK